MDTHSNPPTGKRAKEDIVRGFKNYKNKKKAFGDDQYLKQNISDPFLDFYFFYKYI